MEIQVRIVTQYGNKRIQPVCETAKRFARIAGTSTLTAEAINEIKALGYRVIVVQDVTEL
jgi:hypothetical protein